MTYIENVFICMASPLLIAALCMGRRQAKFFLCCLAGMGACLLSAYINTFFAALYAADTITATAEIAPVVEEVMRTEKHTVLALVLAVAGNTLGVIINPHTRASREWWEAGKKEVMQACNFSRGSFYMARKVALLRGYIVMKQGERESCYRLRFVGDPVDNSVDNWN